MSLSGFLLVQQLLSVSDCLVIGIWIACVQVAIRLPFVWCGSDCLLQGIVVRCLPIQSIIDCLHGLVNGILAVSLSGFLLVQQLLSGRDRLVIVLWITCVQIAICLLIGWCGSDCFLQVSVVRCLPIQCVPCRFNCLYRGINIFLTIFQASIFIFYLI